MTASITYGQSKKSDKSTDDSVRANAKWYTIVQTSNTFFEGWSMLSAEIEMFGLFCYETILISYNIRESSDLHVKSEER